MLGFMCTPQILFMYNKMYLHNQLLFSYLKCNIVIGRWGLLGGGGGGADSKE